MVNRGQYHTGANVVSTDRSKSKQIGRGRPTYNQERSSPRNQDIERIKSILGDIGDPSIKAALESIIADPTMKALPSNIAKTSTNKTASRSHEKQHFEHTITGTLTDAEMLSTGLSYAGFNLDWQRKVCTKTNLKRFKAFFGLPPSTLVPIFSDLSRKFPKIRAREFLMTMNWFTLYEVFPVLAGRWGRCEDHIGPTIKEYGEMIQSLLSSKIKFEFDNTSRVFVASYDTVNFLVQEFRLDPSSKWFDVKSHSSGLKYAFCLSLEKPEICWVEGGVPPSVADITLFRGGKREQDEKNWDKKSLYFQVPKGKKIIADDGLAGEPSKIMIASRSHPKDMRHYISAAKARQETLHTRLKSFNILGHRFCHGKNTQEKMKLHKMAVEATCVLIQYDFENGHPPYDMPY